MEEWEYPAGVVLEAPLTSVAAVVADTHLRLVPYRDRLTAAIRAVLYDHFDSLSKVPLDDLLAPVLVLHGQRDAVVPYRHGKALSEKAGFAFQGFPEANHQNICDQPDFTARLQRWIAEQVRPSNPGSPGLQEGSPNSELIRQISSWENLSTDADGFALP